MGFGTPPTVLEGDYSTWTLQWSNALDLSRISTFAVNEAANNILIYDGYYGEFYTVNLSDGTVTSETYGRYVYAYEQNIFNSVLNKYVANVNASDDKLLLIIYKNNVLKQTINLTDSLGWSAGNCQVAVSLDGKYILIARTNVGSALFKGS
jgi:hypothetical protein